MFNDLYQLGIVHGYAFITCVILVGYLLALSVIDIERFQLPDRLTLSLLWVGLMLHALFTPQFLASSVIGAAAGYFFFYGLFIGW